MDEDRKKRKKLGGRKKGTPNKASAFKEALIAQGGDTPLEFMLRMMRDENQPMAIRGEMAKSAAPYVHPKLASIEHKGDANNPIQHQVGFRWMTEAEARDRGWA